MQRVALVALAVLAGCSDSGEEASTADAATDTAAPQEDAASDAVTTDGVSGDVASEASPPKPKFLDTFPVGVDAQPQYSWDKWKMRGIDTLCRAELQDKTIEWLDAEAKKAGLRLIREPLTKASDDVGNAALLAWSHGDEPDLHMDTSPPSKLKATYDEWKKLDPSRLVFVNVSGWNLMNMPGSSKCNEDCYKQFAEAADWIGNDYYPVNIAQDVEWVGKAVDKLRTLSGGKAQLAYIEASDQELPWAPTAKGPTPEQLRAEIWDAVVHGARGICYFPQRIGGSFSYDNMEMPVVTEMQKQNALLHEVGGKLQGEIDPSSMKVTVPAPLEAGWRDGIVIVVNLKKDPVMGVTISLGGVTAMTANVHGESRSVAITGGTMKDDFAGYGVHVYEL